MTFVDVVVPLAWPKMLTYHANEKQDLVSGHRVIVQVANRQYTGIVFLVHKNAPSYKTKPILLLFLSNLWFTVILCSEAETISSKFDSLLIFTK